MANEELFHLSNGQRPWVDDPRDPTPRHQVVAPTSADTDVETLAARWRDITARHEVLRTAFRDPGGLSGLLQTTEAQAAAMRVVETTSTREVADDEWTRRLDLTAGRLVRAVCAGDHVVLTAAAAVADPRSLELLAAELVTGEPAEQDPLPFLDYAAWEVEQLADDSADARVARAYWLGLVGEPELADPTPVVAGALREALALDGDGPMTAQHWLAALALVQGRRAATEDRSAQIAVAVDGRTDDELAHAVGPLERYVPVVAPADGRADLATTAMRLAGEVEAARRFAMFAPDPVTTTAFSARGPGIRSTLGQFPIELVVTGPSAVLWYDADRCSEAEAGWLAAQIVRAAVGIRDQPSTAAADLDVVGEAERAFLDAALTGEGATPLHPTVPAALAAHASQRPAAPALVNGSTTVTYAELDAATHRLAAALAEGSGPIGILLDASIEAVVAAAGIMRAGRPYVALEPTHPAERIAVQLDVAGVDVVVTAREHRHLLPDSAAPLMLAEVPEAPPEAADVGVTGADLAYLIFTSGSTGVPKAVAVTHDNLVTYAAGVSARLGLDHTSRMAAVTGLSTDLGNTSVYGALLSGGTLDVVAGDAVSNGAGLASHLATCGVTALKITPSHLRALLSGADVHLGLPLLICGGEPLDAGLVEAARAAGVDRVVNHYGPSETTVGVLSHEVVEGPEGPIPLGRPLPHVVARVVDHHGRSSPVGVVGELEIAGAAVSAGYLEPAKSDGSDGSDGSAGSDESDESDESDGPASRSGFIVDADGRRRYRTGDLVRMRPNGTLSFVGRADSQVKVRGFRVDLGEVEVRLRAHPAVADAAAVVVDDAIRAFVVTPDQPLDVAATLDGLGRQLPAHMVPFTVVAIARLPHTASGKVDRAALAELVGEGAAEPGASGRSPSTVTESDLLEIWREVMPGAVAGVDDNFFQIGGHSLLATKVIARSRAVFGVDLPLHVIFASPSVTAMAAEIDRLRTPSDDELDALLADLGGLSDAEVASLLDEPPPHRDDP